MPWHNRIVDVETAIVDHERNPEYEVHVGQIVSLNGQSRRLVSIWLAGTRWSGYLTQGDPRTGPAPGAGDV